MIGFLRGTLISKRPPALTLDVGGVGYELEAPMSTFYRLPDTGQPLSLVTHLVVREDAHVLFGFFTEAERALFRTLLKISNVGPRTALGVLSGMSVEGFYQCIREKDLASLMKIPGVGQKTADRLLLEMKDRLPESIGTDSANLPGQDRLLGSERLGPAAGPARQAQGAARQRRALHRPHRWRADRGDAAPGHGEPVGQQGHRHRAQLCAAGTAHRARHRIPPAARRRIAARPEATER